MEKHQVPSLMGGKQYQVGRGRFKAAPLNNGGSPEAPVKLSREEVSRCIIIWAKFYRQHDDQLGPSELCLPLGLEQWRRSTGER